MMMTGSSASYFVNKRKFSLHWECFLVVVMSLLVSHLLSIDVGLGFMHRTLDSFLRPQVSPCVGTCSRQWLLSADLTLLSTKLSAHLTCDHALGGPISDCLHGSHLVTDVLGLGRTVRHPGWVNVTCFVSKTHLDLLSEWDYWLTDDDRLR